MLGTVKVKIVFFVDGDTLQEEVFTVEQLVMGQHLEWFNMAKKEIEGVPLADWRIDRVMPNFVQA